MAGRDREAEAGRGGVDPAGSDATEPEDRTVGVVPSPGGVGALPGEGVAGPGKQVDEEEDPDAPPAVGRADADADARRTGGEPTG